MEDRENKVRVQFFYTADTYAEFYVEQDKVDRFKRELEDVLRMFGNRQTLFFDISSFMNSYSLVNLTKVQAITIGAPLDSSDIKVPLYS